MKEVGRFTFAVVGLGLVACAAPIDPYAGLRDGESNASATETANATEAAAKATKKDATIPGSCGASGGLAGADPTKLPVCTGSKGTKGRCVAQNSLGSFADQLEQAGCAAGQACVPDQLVKDGTNVQLKKCTAVLDTEGRCFWPVQKEILENYDILKSATKDQCDDGMVCAPCINPLTQADSGVCGLGGGAASGGSDENCSATPGGGASPPPGNLTPPPPPGGATCPQVTPVVDVSTFQAEDCGSSMLCIPGNLVPAEQAAMLKACSKGKCAPKKAVERAGNYVPKTCKSIADSEGRCLAAAIPQIAAEASVLPQADCDADERCAPCFDPRTGADTGACRMASCDAPKQPKTQLAACCGGRGTCVPSTAVDAATSQLLQPDSCTGSAPLCAPTELVGSGAAKRCTAAFGLLTGICVSKCTINGLVAGLAQGDCNADEMCAPCAVLPAGSCK